MVIHDGTGTNHGVNCRHYQDYDFYHTKAMALLEAHN
jgi:hypothetical protein